MKRTLMIFALVMMTAVSSYAHSLMMSVNSNGDGTATVYGVYSTGAEAAGTPVSLLDGSEKILLTGTTDSFGEWTYKIPEVPYEIFLDGGAGHQVRQSGITN